MNIKNNLKPQIIYSSQASKKENLNSAFRYIPVQSTRDFINLFFALPNDMNSHRVYFYRTSVRAEEIIRNYEFTGVGSVERWKKKTVEN
jgi:hypothetical protein